MRKKCDKADSLGMRVPKTSKTNSQHFRAPQLMHWRPCLLHPLQLQSLQMPNPLLLQNQMAMILIQLVTALRRALSVQVGANLCVDG